MNCQRCGRDNQSNVAYCQGCGAPVAAAQNPQYASYNAPQPGYPQQPGYPPQQFPAYVVAGPTNYAGIGARFLAALIDGVVIGIPIGIISSVLGAMMATRVIGRASGPPYNSGMAANDIGTFFAGFGFIMILSILITWAYFALMESSSWQGTVGKKVMGIQVTDVNGARISIGRATIRLLIKCILSGWFLIGYIMAFFTQRKQALHDLIAGTLVLTKQPYAAAPAPYPPVYSPQQPVYPQQPPAYVPQQSACPYCGSGLQPGARFCSSCGRNL